MTIASGSLWVTPSLLKMLRNRSLPVRITSMAKWRQQLKINRAPDAHSWRIAEVEDPIFKTLLDVMIG
jgi:hypothetical protein